jgi:hypothetical protein
MWHTITTIKNPLCTLHRKHNFQCIHPNLTIMVPQLKYSDTYNLPIRQCTQVQHSPYTSRDMAMISCKLQVIPVVRQLLSLCALACSLPRWQPVTGYDPTPCTSQCPLQPQRSPVSALKCLDTKHFLHTISSTDHQKRTSYVGKHLTREA